MRYLRWIALVCFVVGFIAALSPSYAEHRYLLKALWALGMVCLVIWMVRKRA